MRRRHVSLLLACAGITLITLGLLPQGASADTPQRVGWWNAASANGTAAPSPTTPAGGMRVAAGPLVSGLPVAAPQGPVILAYGAVLYGLAEGHTATLRLKIAGTAQGTPQLAACPTSNDTWVAGDDQAASSEPAYDCSAQHFAGSVSSDGISVSFTIASPFEAVPGQISLAIVPDPASTALPTGSSPFAVDIAPPDATSFTSDETAAPPSAEPAPSLPAEFAPASGGVPPTAGAPLGLPAVAVNTPPPAIPATPAPSPPAQRAALPSGGLRAAAAAPPSPLRVHAATALGVAALLAAVLMWSRGYGLLGGRVVPLSVPIRRE